MGTIKDIVDLSTQLATSVNDRKIADELNKIQSLTLQLQSEQADLHEKNIELRETLVTEKEKNQGLNEQVKRLEGRLEEKGKVQYEKPYYWRVDGESKEGPFCQRCQDVDNKLIRLQQDDDNYWSCRECDSRFWK